MQEPNLKDIMFGLMEQMVEIQERLQKVEDFLVLDEEEGCEDCQEEKNHQASPNLQLFFEKLLKLKEEAKKRSECSYHRETAETWSYVYQRLDEIIKEKK